MYISREKGDVILHDVSFRFFRVWPQQSTDDANILECKYSSLEVVSKTNSYRLKERDKRKALFKENSSTRVKKEKYLF